MHKNRDTTSVTFLGKLLDERYEIPASQLRCEGGLNHGAEVPQPIETVTPAELKVLLIMSTSIVVLPVFHADTTNFATQCRSITC